MRNLDEMNACICVTDPAHNAWNYHHYIGYAVQNEEFEFKNIIYKHIISNIAENNGKND